MKRSKNLKFTSLLLAVVMLLANFPYTSYYVQATEQENTIDTDTLKIYCDGKLINDKAISMTDKFEFTAVGVSDEASYQWQIMNPAEYSWVDIADKQENTCDVSCALIQSMLEEADSTALRCIADKDGIQYISNSVAVVLYEDIQENAEYTDPSASRPMLFAARAAATDPPEYVTITIRYTLNENKLFDDYKATLHYGSSFSSKVPSPTYLGYDPYIKDTDELATLVTLSYVNLTEDQVIDVEYRPGKAPYSVRYYLQNITDDNYIEDFTLSFNGEAVTDSYPKAQIEKDITGFTSLYHVPSKVAADGSTVFECYYDRNYYLYSFDCNGGYGTDSVYARYGSHLVVPHPIRAGYVFAGWDEQVLDLETGTYTGDGIVDELPTSIGAENKVYAAVWEPVMTTVKIVYWNENPDDDGYNYWDSRIIHTLSGTEIGIDDILAPCRMHNTVGNTDDPAYTVSADLGTLTDHDAELLKDATYNNYWASNGVDGKASFTITAHDMEHPTLDCIALDFSDAYTDMDAENMKVDIDVHVNYQNGGTLDKTFKDIYLSDDFTLNKQTAQTSPIKSITFTFYNRQRLDHGAWVADNFEFRCAEVEIFSGTDVPISVIPNTDTVSAEEFSHYTLNTERTTAIAAQMYNNAAGNAIVVEGDGSTIINIYYQRRVYHFRFFYARTFKGTYNGVENVDIWQIPGQTQSFGGQGDTVNAIQSNYNYDIADKLQLAKWWTVYDNVAPTLTDDASGKYTIETFEARDYATGIDCTYYALKFTAKYGQDISDIYPINSFNPIYSPDSPWSEYIIHSSWTGEPYVRFAYKANLFEADPSNYGDYNGYLRTMKGKFLRAEGDMLYYYDYFGDRYQTDEDGRIVNFCAYWGNVNTTSGPWPNNWDASPAGWNAALQWHHYIWQEMLPEDVESLPIPANTSDSSAWTANNWTVVEEFIGNASTASACGWEITIDGKKYRRITHTNGDVDYYALYYDYLSYDNNIGNIGDNGTWGFAKQTATEIKGFTLRRRMYGGTYTVEDQYAQYLKIKSGIFWYQWSNTGSDGTTGFIGNFYYNRNDYDLRLYNHSEYVQSVSSEEKVSVPYQRNLYNVIKNADAFNLSDLNPAYPSIIAAGTYEFGGWYGSPLFLPETEVINSSVMKATNVTLYAKWAPIKHQVTFYNSLDDLTENESLVPTIKVSHGEYIPTAKIPTPDKSKLPEGQGYLFVGWFYFNSDGVKTAFDPGSIPVQTDLDLFAEWYSSLSVGYTIHYKEYKTDSSVADDVAGWTYAGITRTFEAKPYSELYGGGIVDGLRYYPLKNSSSIVVSKTASENVVTFEYGKRASVNYKVQYVNASTGKVITVDGNGDPVDGVKEVSGCTDAVVTEKYKFISGYLPDAFYKERILTYYDKDTGGEIENENVITFYYTEDISHARYAVRYWTQDLSDPNTYSLDHTYDGIGDIGAQIVADITAIRGFSFNRDKTFEENPKATIEDTQIKATLTVDEHNDLILDLYFDRISCQYTIRFVEYGDNENTANKLHTDLTLQGVYGASGSFSVADACTLGDSGGHVDGNSFIKLLHNGVEYQYKDVGSTGGNYSLTFTESQIVDGNEKWPVLLIYYTTDTYEIFYIPVTKYPGLGDCRVSIHSETVSNDLSIQGSTAIPDSAYTFEGWFTDYDCTVSVNESWLSYPEEEASGPKEIIKPQLTGVKTVYYYALFEPKKTTLTITKEVKDDLVNAMTGVTDTFVFTVKGKAGTAAAIVDMTVAITGNGSVTIADLPIGTYTVTEKTDWSWRYDVIGSGTENVTLQETGTNEVTFQNTPNDKAWLGGEAYKDNTFTDLPVGEP